MGMIINPYAFGAAYDADAQAFFTAAGITDNTQKTAVNQLVVDLKTYGIWTKMKAIYPFVGGTSTTHKYNLKDPQDTDGAFRLVFSGGWTHSSTGADPGGVNGYADTKFNQMNSWTSTSNASAGIYLRENVASTAVDIGASSNAGNGDNSTIIYSRYTGDNFYGSANGTGVSGAANTNSQGFFAVSRTNTTQHSIYKRGSSTINQTSSVNIGTNINKTIYIGAANNNGVADYFSNREIAFAFFGDGLTQSEVGDYYTAVQAFQTTLGRNV